MVKKFGIALGLSVALVCCSAGVNAAVWYDQADMDEATGEPPANVAAPTTGTSVYSAPTYGGVAAAQERTAAMRASGYVGGRQNIRAEASSPVSWGDD